MAVSVGGEDVTQRPGWEAANIPTLLAPGIQDRSSSETRLTGRSRREWPFRGFGSSSILVILAWLYVTIFSLYLKKTLQTFSLNGKGPISPWFAQFNNVIYYTTFAISCPAASFIAEVFISRLKLIRYTLRALWLLYIADSVISLCNYCLPIAQTTSYVIGHYAIAIPAVALEGAFTAVVVPLCLDQIAGASNMNTSALIVWFLWTMFSAYSTVDIFVPILYDCRHLPASEVNLIISLLPVLLLSVGVILDFRFQKKLVQEPVTVNPVSLVFKVLKYAVNHKSPVQRSAFTYCENERPSRLDYGKSKYGGPFTTEQVEDVKTFWRVLVVIAVISMLYAPIESVHESYRLLESQFHSGSKSPCIEGISKGAFMLSSFIAYSVPLYELLIYPCLRNRGPSILQSAGIGAAALITSPLYGMMVEVTRQVTTNGTAECMFIQNPPNKSTIDFFIVVPLSFILGVAMILLYKARIEFVCAQAPYNMNGLLIGLCFMLQTLFRAVGAILYIAWKNKWFGILKTNTCGIWFYLVNLILALAISMLLYLVVRRYKARERDEIRGSQMLVEDVYCKYMQRLNSDDQLHTS